MNTVSELLYLNFQLTVSMSLNVSEGLYSIHKNDQPENAFEGLEINIYTNEY